jgi:hypothetical protein
MNYGHNEIRPTSINLQKNPFKTTTLTVIATKSQSFLKHMVSFTCKESLYKQRAAEI